MFAGPVDPRCYWSYIYGILGQNHFELVLRPEPVVTSGGSQSTQQKPLPNPKSDWQLSHMPRQ